MSTRRWTLHDPVAGETWTMPINPDSMTPVHTARTMTHAAGFARDTRIRTFVGAPPERTLDFAGAIRTQAHHDELLRWTAKTNEIELTDHLGRTFVVYIVAFDATDRRSARTDWRMRYTVKTKLLEGP